MPERRSTLAEVAERMRKSPRWLRSQLRTLQPVGDLFGRTWTFTAAQEQTLIDLLQRQFRPTVQLGKAQKSKRYGPVDDMMAEALRLAREKPERKRRSR